MISEDFEDSKTLDRIMYLQKVSKENLLDLVFPKSSNKNQPYNWLLRKKQYFSKNLLNAFPLTGGLRGKP